jgi:hypothetical protein
MTQNVADDALGLQEVQQRRGLARVGAVVEGERGDVAGAARRGERGGGGPDRAARHEGGGRATASMRRRRCRRPCPVMTMSSTR